MTVTTKLYGFFILLMFNCKYCNKEYYDKTKLGGHTVWCIGNPNRRITVKDTYYNSPKNCKQCGEIIPFEKRGHDCCNHSCSATFSNHNRDWKPDDEFKRKISNTLKETYKLNSTLNSTLKEEAYNSNPKKCKICNSDLEYKNKKLKTCSPKCLNVSRKLGGTAGGKKSAQVQAESRRSKNEILFSEKCIEYFDKVLTNESIFNGWDADIIIEDLKVAILWNGKWHYEKITEKHSVKQVQNRDKIKVDEIKKYGYIPYIIKDMGKFSEDKVNKEFDKFLKRI